MSAAFPVDYQQLFRSLPENFLLIAPDKDATIVDNTDSHVGVSLKKREDVVGKPFFEAYPATDAASAAIIAESHEHVRRQLTAHAMPLIRYDLPRPAEQGGGLEELYWQATHYPVLDAQGNLQYILQCAQDVTEQVRARHEAARIAAELAEIQQRSQFILEHLPVMVWTNRPDGSPNYYNSRWETFTGLSSEQGQNWRETSGLVHPDDTARVARQVNQAVAEQREYQLEFRLRRHDGQYRWLLARNVPRFDSQGQLLMWVGTGVEIHDYKLLVQELLDSNEQQAQLSEQAYQAQLQAQRQRQTFYTLFMQTPAMICILRGPEHRFEFVNPAYQQLFPHRQLLGHTVAEVLPEVVGQGFVALLDQVYTTGETFVGNEVEVMLDRDGSGQLQRRYFNFTYQQFQENDEKAGTTVFAFDVTELVHARQQQTPPGSDAQ